MGTKRSIFTEVKRRGHDIRWFNKADIGKIVQFEKMYEPDQMWLAHSNLLLPVNIKAQLKSTVVGFGFSDPYYFKPTRFDSYDVYVTNHMKTLERYKDKLPMHYNPTACDLSFHKKTYSRKTIDVSLIGCGRHLRFPNKMERVDVINKLRVDLPAASILAFGRGWPAHKDNKGFIDGEVFLSKVQLSRIGLDIQAEFSPLAHRMFEYISCGTPVITRRRPEVDLHLVDGKEILTYDDYEELLMKINYYLSHSKELQQIAVAGYHRVIAEHDVNNRVDALLTFLMDLP
jgi:hypothetical protein